MSESVPKQVENVEADVNPTKYKVHTPTDGTISGILTHANEHSTRAGPHQTSPCCSQSSTSALAAAIFFNNVDTIKAFIKAGVKIDADTVRATILDDRDGKIYHHGETEYLLLGTRELANCGCLQDHDNEVPHNEDCDCYPRSSLLYV